MDIGKLIYSISTDLVLQPEAYRSMVKAIRNPTINTRHLRLAALSAEYSPSLYFQIKRN